MGKFEDLTGKKFGRLLVLKRVKNDEGNHSRWLCQCSCGNTIITRGCRLKEGSTKSCGCLRKEQHPTNYKHHKYGTRLYRIWDGMKQRCYNPNFKKRKFYLDKGIKRSEETKRKLSKIFTHRIGTNRSKTKEDIINIVLKYKKLKNYRKVDRFFNLSNGTTGNIIRGNLYYDYQPIIKKILNNKV